MVDVRALIAAGDLAAAESACAALAEAGADADALFTLGALRLQTGRAAEALPPLERAVALAPGAAQVQLALGLARHGAGQHDGAVEALQAAATLDPASAPSHTNLGNALKALGRYDEAALAHREALRLQPAFAEGWSNLGSTWLDAGRPAEAVRAMARAADLAPAHPEMQFNLGRACLADDDPHGAETALRRTLELAPTHVHAAVALGSALKGQGRLDDAVAALRHAVTLDRDHADAHWNLALALLMRGDWGEGWAEYEWRLRIPDMCVEPFDAPAWEGSPLAGRTLLVHAEQALGDAIQFARFAIAAQRTGGRVVLRCPDKLCALLGGLTGDVALAPAGEPPPPFDVHAPLMSLPHLLDTPGEGLATDHPYLAADPARAKPWLTRIGRGRRLRVGIGWQGSPTYLADHQRSMPLRHLLPLLRSPHVRTFSLQKGFGSEQLAELPGDVEVEDLGPDLDEGPDAFVDTAAVLSALDLLVCTDTALPHLAGALGVPVWMLLPHVPDWRWALAGERTPWYPSMRLIRQRSPGDWEGTMRDVMRAIADRRA